MGGPLEIVDAHVHFWDHAVPGLDWAWLRPDFEHPRLGALKTLDAPRYTADEFRQEVSAQAVRKIVHVQAAQGEDPAAETAWLEEMSSRCGWPDAIIGRCDLRSPGVAVVLARHQRFARFRGVRDIPSGSHLDDPLVDRAFGLLAAAGASVEIMTSHEHFPALLDLVRAHPDLLVVVGHGGLPLRRDAEYYREWLRAMGRLGREPNTVCKISALAGADATFSVEALRPWVLGCLETFGVDGCMFASNWPVDKLFTTYAELMDGYARICDRLAAAELEQVFARTAERVYRI